VLDDPLATLPLEVLAERLGALVREACAWAVGLSDQPHLQRRQGRTVGTGTTLGVRAEAGRPLAEEGCGRLDLGDAPAGSFADALNALAPGGGVWADRLEAEVVRPFVAQACLAVAERARLEHPYAWAELLDDLGEDGDDPAAVARAADWDSLLRGEAEDRLLAALGQVPLVDVEAEGLPLSVVRAAERAVSYSAVVAPPGGQGEDDDLAGAVFLARRALQDAGLDLPAQPQDAARLYALLRECGLEPDEVVRVLDELPVTADTAERAARSARTEQDLVQGSEP
jgi:hypothetical protein